MKALTKNLIYFMVLFLIGAIAFRYGLSTLLENRAFTLAWIIAGAYFAFNYFTGWFFGKRDHETLPLYDVGFRFHLATYLLFNIVGVAWFKMGFQSRFEYFRDYYYLVIIWGIAVIIHFAVYLITRKNAIKRIKKSEIFE